MKSYRRRTRYTGRAKKKKVLGAILGIACLLGIFVGALFVGNLFRIRLETAASQLAYEPEPIVEAGEEPSVLLPAIPPKGLAGEKIRCLPLTKSVLPDTEARDALLAGYKEQGAGVSLLFSRDTELDTLTQVTESARSAGLYLSFILYPSFAAETDAPLFTAIYDLHGQDILLAGFTETTLDDRTLARLLSYLTDIRQASPALTLGLALPPAVFQDPAAGGALDTLALSFDYLAVDLTRLSPEEVPDAWRSLYGSAAYYDLALFCRDGELVRELPVQNLRILP